MLKKHHLQDLIEPIVEEKGYELVRIITIGNVNPTLQIMIERPDREPIIVDDCAKVSRAISAIMDEKDPISGKYTLEVSSPGLDRPLVKLENFERFAGLEAKIETDTEVDKRKRFKGRIIEVDDKNNIIIEMEEQTYAIPYDAITKAKLVLNDELLALAAAEAEDEDDEFAEVVEENIEFAQPDEEELN